MDETLKKYIFIAMKNIAIKNIRKPRAEICCRSKTAKTDRRVKDMSSVRLS